MTTSTNRKISHSLEGIANQAGSQKVRISIDHHKGTANQAESQRVRTSTDLLKGTAAVDQVKVKTTDDRVMVDKMIPNMIAQVVDRMAVSSTGKELMTMIVHKENENTKADIMEIRVDRSMEMRVDRVTEKVDKTINKTTIDQAGNNTVTEDTVVNPGMINAPGTTTDHLAMTATTPALIHMPVKQDRTMILTCTRLPCSTLSRITSRETWMSRTSFRVINRHMVPVEHRT